MARRPCNEAGACSRNCVTRTEQALKLKSRSRQTQSGGFSSSGERTARRHGIEFLERIQTTDEKHATALLQRHTDKKYSLCDAFLVVMERVKLKKAIAFDAQAYGRFVLLQVGAYGT